MRILHVLSQQPGRTGSGVTLDAVVCEASRAGHDQAALVGVPADAAAPAVGALPDDAVHAVRFAGADGGPGDLDFPVPGMSDVMPYPSTVWSTMTPDQLDRYRAAWRRRLRDVIERFEPDLIHTHHLWLVSSLVKQVAPTLPALATCHSTGLRQMELVPHLADEVRRGCRQLDLFCVLRDDHGDRIRQVLGVGPERIRHVGAGFRADLFHDRGRRPGVGPHLLYVGKFSEAKGLPWLLDAFASLRAARPDAVLHIAGGGAGSEAEALRERLTGQAGVRLHGQLDQPALADLMRRCRVVVLPSFYEGVPLVLVEAAACGCRLVATALPGVVAQIAPALAERLTLVPVPRLRGVDRPEPADLPRFTANLAAALAAALDAGECPAPLPPDRLAPFAWKAVFERVEAAWRVLNGKRGHDIR